MHNPEEPISVEKEAVQLHGPVHQGQDSLVTEKRTYVDERGLVEEQETRLVTCASCGRVITQQEIGGVCSECSQILDKLCAEAVSCSHPECGRILCRSHATYIHSIQSYRCSQHVWSTLLKPFLLGLGVLLVLAVSVGMCGVLG